MSYRPNTTSLNGRAIGSCKATQDPFRGVQITFEGIRGGLLGKLSSDDPRKLRQLAAEINRAADLIDHEAEQPETEGSAIADQLGL